jgi:hypothetical protein
MKIGIVGSRRKDTKEDYEKVLLEFTKRFIEGDTIVSGGCPKGGDRFAETISHRYNIPIKIYPANWKLGKSAGFLRNSDIAKESDILIACVAENRKGGTEDTIKKFIKFHGNTNLYLV